MPTRMGGHRLGWTGSPMIESTCSRLLPQTFDEVVCFSARQWYPLMVRSGCIQQARIMLLDFMLSQNGNSTVYSWTSMTFRQSC